MPKKDKSSGKYSDVRSIMPVQSLNGLSGFAPRTSPERTTAPCGFFVPESCTHLSMVGRAGEPQGSPGSLVTGSANPVRLTTSQRFATLDVAPHFLNVLHSPSVLNTPPRSGCRARQTCGFFTSIEFYGRVACSTYNTPRGKNYRPSSSGVQVPGHPTEHGAMNNLEGRPS
jgi:hypothetical protein